MRKESVVSCVTVCVLGAIAFFIRWAQMNNSFEEDTGLLIKGSAWTIAVIVICVASAAVVFFLTFSLSKRAMPTEYARAMKVNSLACPVSGMVLGLMMIIGSAILMIGTEETVLRWLGALGILTGICIPILLIAPKRRVSGLTCAASVIPAVFYCLWLVAGYMQNAENPVIWSFCMEILAAAASVLGFYYAAGYPFGRPRPRNTVLFCLLGAFFGITAMGDFPGLAKSLMLFSGSIVQLLTATVLINNMSPGGRQKIQELE